MSTPSYARTLAAIPNSQKIARWVGSVYVVGAVVALIWTIIPHPDHAGDKLVVAMAGMALIGGLTMLSGAVDEVAEADFHLVLAALQVVITLGYVAVPGANNDARLFYMWATPIAAFFFRPRAAAMHAAFVAALLGVGVAVHRPAFAEGLRIWVMTVGVLVAVTAIVAAAAIGVRNRDREMSHAATHDPLTGLANRSLFSQRVAEALSRRRMTRGQVFLMMIDLDRLKVLNDTQGHHAGDELLKSLAGRFAANVPPHSTVARLGGDEFAVLVEDPDHELSPHAVANALAMAWSDPVELERGHFRASACIGVAIATDDDQPSGLLRNADAAMYRAKAAGRSRIHVYDEDQRAGVHRRMRLEQALFDAVDNNELSVVYQPIVDLVSGQARAAEALVRWIHPHLGIVPPGEFIPLAEECGLIDEIGLWVLHHALAQLKEWRTANIVDEAFTIHVNVSGAQLHGQFAADVANVLTTYGVEPKALLLELTESVLMRDGAEATDVMRAIDAMGVPLALDDFGTGFSSLSYLHQANVHTVKIDQSFVGGMSGDGTRNAIVTAVVALTRALGFTVIAEGVDTRDQVELLLAMGCGLGQGFLFSRPMDAEAMADFIRPTHQLSGIRWSPSLAAGGWPESTAS
jgi:diguanylate cyclase (GGDEF)-like protein